ncbi:hypothetical protein F4803DRAFT_566489 [Xylaria telfairii]|nr:hypothetical protein F4803DRAFT_566489 [Xylaria telfairii]
MDDGVYLGVWTNWSRGAVFGLTLTTTKQPGNLLIALTAVFVSFVASRFWRIVCLCLHRLYSTSNPEKTMCRQQQVILRNSTAAEAGLWAIIQLLWAWRQLPASRLSRILPTGILAIICITAFTIAGGFSSSISTAVGDEVLIYSPSCAILWPTNNSLEVVASTYNYFSGKLNDAANYAQQCYDGNNSTSGTTACSKFVRSTLPTASANTSASCPFDEKICRKPRGNIRLDTGYIGNDELGFNRPNDLGFAWRYVLHCAPLITEGYTKYAIDNFEQSTPFDGQLDPGSSKLIPELARPDGDTTVIFLSGNGVVFMNRMDDDWYRATRRSIDIYMSGGAGYIPSYIPSIAASPMGCVEQWQWCNSTNPTNSTQCGPLASLFDAFSGAATVFNISEGEYNNEPRPSSSDASKADFLWVGIGTANSPTILPRVIGHLGAKSLASQSHLMGIQYPLPNNQWQLDVTRWWHTILAAVQASCTAQGSNDPNIRQLLSPPLNSQERKLCNSQKIRSSQHVSFSLFGLLFTFVAGAIIICLSYVLEPILGCLYRYKKHRPHAHFEWMTNGSLQLYRLAHENLGMETWSNCTNEVPITMPDVVLNGIDFSDPEHPLLNRQVEGNDAQLMSGDFESNGETENEGGDQFHEGNRTSTTGTVVDVGQVLALD